MTSMLIPRYSDWRAIRLSPENVGLTKTTPRFGSKGSAMFAAVQWLHKLLGWELLEDSQAAMGVSNDPGVPSVALQWQSLEKPTLRWNSIPMLGKGGHGAEHSLAVSESNDSEYMKTVKVKDNFESNCSREHIFMLHAKMERVWNNQGVFKIWLFGHNKQEEPYWERWSGTWWSPDWLFAALVWEFLHII